MEPNRLQNGLAKLPSWAHMNCRSGVNAQLPESVSIVVGIPSRNEAKTIGAVATVVDAGLQLLNPRRSALIVNADNSSTDGTSQKFLDTPTQTPKVTIDTAPAFGKGVNVLAILHMANHLNANVVCLFDADVRTALADWVSTMVEPVLNTDMPTLVTPVYSRNPFEGNTTNHIVAPILFAVFGRYVQQPIAGEFALNRSMLRRILTWLIAESTLHYGIDVFLSGNALADSLNVSEVQLTRKLHSPGFPKILFMSQQVLDTLLRIVSVSPWTAKTLDQSETPRLVSELTELRRSVDQARIRPSDSLVRSTANRVRDYLDQYSSDIEAVLGISLSSSISRRGLPYVDHTTWIDILTMAIVRLNPESFYAIRDHLVALYVCRVLTYWEELEIEDVSAIERQLVLEAVGLRERLASQIVHEPVAWGAIPLQLRPGYWAKSTGGE